MSDEPWTVVVFRDERGREAVTDFLKGLEPRMRLKVARNLNALAEKGPSLGMPLSRPIRGFGLSELRTQASGNICRIFYFATSGRRLVLLHGFTKKTAETPQRELRLAADRRDAFLRRDQ